MRVLAGPGDTAAQDAAAIVRQETDFIPSVAVILGSGLGEALAGMEVEADLAYPSLPGFPDASVVGHAGRLRLGTLAGVRLAAFLGRLHYYEGHPMSVVTLPARLAAALGAQTLVVTAAVGCLDPSLPVGSLVVGTDHLSFLGENPLRGWRDADGHPLFVDLRGAYDPALADLAETAARDAGQTVARGVYAAVAGPTYETAAESELIRRAGASVIGMSVVPEVCAAAALGLRCVGLFSVSNVVGAPVSHEEILAAGAEAAGPLGNVLERLLRRIGDLDG